MRKYLKGLFLVGALTILGTSAFGALEVMKPGTDDKWSGAADVKIRVTGTVLDLDGKYGILVKPVKGGINGDLVLDFGNVAVGDTTQPVDSEFDAYVVSNDSNGNLLKYEVANDTFSSRLVSRTGLETSTTGDDIITDDGKQMTSKVYTTDGTNTPKLLGTIAHTLTAGLDGNMMDYSGSVKSILTVDKNAKNGVFGADAGRVRVRVTDFKKKAGDNGTFLEGTGTIGVKPGTGNGGGQGNA